MRRARSHWTRGLLPLALALAVPAFAAGCKRHGRPRGPAAPVASGSSASPATSGSAAAGAAADDGFAPPIAEVDLSRGAPEARATGLFRADRATYYDLTVALDDLHDAEELRGVFVRIGGTRLGWARVQEVARTFRGLREQGKVVYCHADELGNATYWMTAEACDRIWLSPAGGLTTVGIAAEMIFAKDALGKLGIEADVLQVGKFKGTGEMATRSSASEESKQSVQGVLSDLRARWIEGVQIGRGRHEVRRGLENGPHSPQEAKAAGLIDDVGYADEAKAALRARVGGGGDPEHERTELVFGPTVERKSRGGAIELVRILTGARKGKRGGHVAVLRAAGGITMERSGGLGAQDGIDARTLTKQIHALIKDDSAKAVVLRIDSPGGSALASDLLWYELMQLRKKKPLIISVGDMAASGGYYLACAGTKIVAEETSIVGSIGVVGGKIAIGAALRPYGINVEAVPAEPGANPARASFLSPFQPWDEATRERVRSTMTQVYDLFLRRVAEGRGIPVEKVASFAEGRIWSGREARALGMVDDWGGLLRAVELARKEAKLDERVEARLVGGPAGLFEVLGLDDDDDEAAFESAARQTARASLGPSSPELDALLTYATSFAPLATGERALVAVPFSFLVRLPRVESALFTPSGRGRGRRSPMASQTPPPDQDPAAPPQRTTLAPPEWNRPAPASATVRVAAPSMPPVARVTGPRADHAWQMARLREARAAQDRHTERQLAVSIARWLGGKGTELDVAVKLARRALALGEDPTLRAELVAMLVSLGEYAVAAADQRPLAEGRSPESAARAHTRVGELLARAGEPQAAADAFRVAMELDPASPLAAELLGSLSVWAPEDVRPEVGAAAFSEASARRTRLHDAEGAFEDRLRAFDLCPEHEGVAEGVAAALVARGREGAADEVRRAHARARGDRERAVAVHLRRIREALSSGDLPRAVAASLDAGLDAVLDGKEAALFDDVLSRSGLYDLASARLVLRGGSLAGPARAAAFLELCRLYAGPMASSERAVEAAIEALAADPAQDEARATLRAQAGAVHDPGALVEGLLRAGARADVAPAARAACFVELYELAEESLADPSLALFAMEERFALGELSVGDRDAARARLSARVRLQDDALAQARAALERAGAGDPGRVDALRRLASLLRGRPREADAYLDVLVALTQALPEERAWGVALERVATRTGRTDVLLAHLRARAATGTRAEIVRARLSLAALVFREGGAAAALEEAAPLLGQASSHRAASSMVLTLAALARDGARHAEALVQLGGPLSAPMRAVFFSTASEAWMALGDRGRGRPLAESACQADPTSARAVSALAAVVFGTRDRPAAAALERAAGVLVPGTALCAELAAMFEELGEQALSIAWTQRWLALRPGDATATAELLRRAGAKSEAPRLADAIGWVLTMPAPSERVADVLGDALIGLAARDPSSALGVARRAADVLGPRLTSIRTAVNAAARAAADRSLVATVLERWVGSGAPPEVRRGALLEIASIRREQGDAMGEARALLRAVKDGAPADVVLERLASVVPGGGSDAALARLEARSEALLVLGRKEEAADVLREVGAARWDLAADPAGAVRAWVRAAESEPKSGPARLVRDLFAFGGPERALTELLAYADQRKSPADAASVLTLAAATAMETGRPADALAAASRAVLLDASRVDALALAERAAEGPSGGERLDALYDHVAGKAMGRYGRRAAHYRAARQLERRGLTQLAARHAVDAFEAVPSVGMTFVLMSRLGQRSGSTTEAVSAIERAADDVADVTERSAWLRRAAALTVDTDEGARQRVDVLLRALNVLPDRQTILDVADALSGLVARHGEEPASAEMRFERAQRAALRRVDGPAGARIAVSFALAALRAFSSGKLAASAIVSGLAGDADIEEYADLVPHAALLAEEPVGSATDFVAACNKLLAQPYANVGPSVLRLAAAIATARGDAGVAAPLLVAAARRAPEDVALMNEAEQAVLAFGDEKLSSQLYDAFPVARRLEALLFVAQQRQDEDDLPRAISALERAFALPDVPDEQRVVLRGRLRDLYLRAGRRDALEALLSHELARPDATVDERVALSRELASLLAARGDAQRALDLLEAAIRLAPPSQALLGEAADVARHAGDTARLTDVLTRQAAVAPPETRIAMLREVADASEDAGDLDTAAARWAEIAAIDPKNRDALAAQERLAAKRGDHDALARALAARIEVSDSADEIRVLRLRRAALLEQRLGRLEEARAELEAILETVEDPSAIRFLADLHERLGAPLRAGPLWMRAYAVQIDPREKADHAARAAEAFLKGGDLREARVALESALRVSRTERMLDLRVQLERLSGNPRGLAEALDELAIASMDPPERRAELLVEAARASLAANEEIAALERAQRGARIAPHSATAQLLARLLEYRARGAGTPQEASQTIEELRRVTGRTTPHQTPLHAFLLAEALDVVSGGNAGMKELSARHAELGASPLIALGMAERLARTASFHAALPFYDSALAGDLQGVRRRGSVALAAADAAYRVDDLDRAAKYFEEAALDATTAHAARQRQATLEQAIRARAEALVPDERRTLRELADRAVGLDRARALAKLGRLLAQNPAERGEADHLFTEAIAIAALDRPFQVELEAERDALRGVPRRASRPPPSVEDPSSLPPTRVSEAPSPRPVAVASQPVHAPSAPPPQTASYPPRETAHSSRPPGVSAQASSVPPDAVRAGAGALTGGATGSVPPVAQPPSVPPAPPVARVASVPPAQPPSVEAQLQAATPASTSSAPAPARISSSPPKSPRFGNSGDARLRVLQAPGNRAALLALREAALLDRNYPWARALEHAAAAFRPTSEVVAPPALALQREQPELIHRVLVPGGAAAVGEALALVWESASHLFRREAGTYGVTGLDRVSFGAVTPASRVYTAGARLLGATRTPLFQRRSSGPISAHVALLVPPAVVLSGDPRDETPELAYRLGGALVAASPEHALLFGLPESQLRSLLAALLLAFGPPVREGRPAPAVAVLAESLWQALPARSQRRLGELCARAVEFAPDTALDVGRRATRRAGLFLSGDLSVAMRETILELSLSLGAPLESDDGVERACSAHPPLADLFALATSPEYASARWEDGRGRTRGSGTSGAFRSSG